MTHFPSFRTALLSRLMNPEAMARIDEPWRHEGSGEIVDQNGVPVAHVSNYHKAQIPLIVVAPILLAAAKAFLCEQTEDNADRLQFAIVATEDPLP